MTVSPPDLLEILDLEQIEDDIFRGRSPQTGQQRIFGGQVAGQALVAAGRTVPAERHVHSLHAYFLVAGDPSVPVVYTVDRIRDGGSFTTRRVVAVQHGRAIFHLSASFQVAEDGFEHADPMPDVPAPEDCPTLEELFGGSIDAMHTRFPIERRYVGRPPSMPPAAGRTSDEPADEPSDFVGVWLRVSSPLPPDPLVQVCAMTYVSDLTLLDSVVAPHPDLSFWDGSIHPASLDHAMWFHQPFRADRWILYRQHSPSAGNGRGLATGQMFTQDGELVVSVVQEGLLRRPQDRPRTR